MSSMFRLLKRHEVLDGELRREQKRRAPDEARIRKLKKLKLAIKDRLLGKASSTALAG